MTKDHEEIYDLPSWDGSDGLLAIIIYSSFHFELGTIFFTPADLPQQLASISHPAGYEIPPHIHYQVPREIRRTQEVLFVRNGRVRVVIYNAAHNFVAQRELTSGDIIALVAGGHGLTILEDAQIIEVKQGPYLGRDRDKRDFDAV